jgi:hypothetical protein
MLLEAEAVENSKTRATISSLRIALAAALALTAGPGSRSVAAGGGTKPRPEYCRTSWNRDAAPNLECCCQIRWIGVASAKCLISTRPLTGLGRRR